MKRDFQDVYPKNLLALFYKLSEYCMLTFNTCLTCQEYPSDPLRKISALQTKVELAGNLGDKQNLAENLVYRELVASWVKVFFGVQIACIFTNFWLEITFRMRSL